MKSNYLFHRVEEIFEEIKEFRRYLHQNPELSFQEINTTKYISKKLTEMGIHNYPALKYPTQNPICDLGVIAEIGSGEDCLALRADIDALPINEETGLNFCSIKDGVMHACGHDMHTAILLATAKILKSIENELTGRVILIFQPAEEFLPGGAKLILDSGVLDKYNISAFFGQHVNPEIELGKVAVVSGPIMASTDEIHITIKGQSAHAAQPHLGKDVILASTSLIQYYQNLLTKFKNPIDSGIISITAIHAGSVTNILPDEAKLLGTIRTYSQELRNDLKKKMIENSPKVVGLYDCTIDLNIMEGYPPVINNARTTDFFEKSAKNILGDINVLKAEPKMWAEDFAYYSQSTPSTFWFLGIAKEDTDFYPLHNPKLNPSEEALIVGTTLMVNLAINYFKQ